MSDPLSALMFQGPDQFYQRAPLEPPIALNTLQDFGRGGLYELMKNKGVEMPSWASTIGNFLQRDDVNTALGMAGGPRAPKGFKFTPENQSALQELLARGAPIDEIGDKLGVSTQKARGIINSIDPRSSPDIAYWLKNEDKFKAEAQARADAMANMKSQRLKVNADLAKSGFSRADIAAQIAAQSGKQEPMTRVPQQDLNPIMALRTMADVGSDEVRQLSKSILEKYDALEKPAERKAFQDRMYELMREKKLPAAE